MPRLKKEIANNFIKHSEEKIVSINSIKLWDKNPYKYKDDVIDKLANIFKKHGQVTSVVVYTKDNMIRKGNKTFLGMKKAGAKKIKAKFVDFESDVIANAYALADNVASTWSKWDDDLVDNILSAKSFKGLDNEELQRLTGFNAQELDLLNSGSFADDNYKKAAEKFEEKKGKLEKKKKYWFWFEVDNKETFKEILKDYGRTTEEGKRLHRELNTKKVLKALI